MPAFQVWLDEFLIGKTETPAPGESKFAIHSLRRFLEGDAKVWEIGETYTGRLVVRSGQIGADGLTIDWSEWITKHDVEMPTR